MFFTWTWGTGLYILAESARSREEAIIGHCSAGKKGDVGLISAPQLSYQESIAFLFYLVHLSVNMMRS